MTSPAPWEAPGPGSWELDPAHQPRPPTRYWLDLFPAAFNTGLGEAFRTYGLPLERFDMAVVNGWAYFRARAVGAPEGGGALPPRWVFQLLFRLHPTLRRRRRAAAVAVRKRLWAAEATRWRETLRDELAHGNAELQAVSPQALDEGELADHVAAATAFARDALRHHFRHAIAQWIGVGDWLRHVEAWTGVAPRNAVTALRGSSPASVRAVPLLQAVADAVARTAAATNAGGTQTLDDLRASSPVVAAALDRYLAECGQQLLSGFDLADRTVAEVPEATVAAVFALVEHGGETARPSPWTPDALRERVPLDRRDEFDVLLADAQALYALREEDVALTYQRPLGLLRRALLAAGHVLVRRGDIDESEHVLDATAAELGVLLGGHGSGISAGELARRAEARRRAAELEPPHRLGEEETPPPSEWFPAGVARVQGAAMLAMTLEESPRETPEPRAGVELTGIAASTGRYTGRARIVLRADDFERLAHGDVLVTHATTPTFMVVLPLIGAIVTDHGGALCHAAIVAREFGLPAVVGTGKGTEKIPDGSRVTVDGARGTVEILEDAAPG